MHMARPKSSKGRSRPKLNHSQSVQLEDSLHHHSSFPPHPPSLSQDIDRRLRSSSFHRRSSLTNPMAISEILACAPEAPKLTINKYKVLPSIEKRDVSIRGMEEAASNLILSDSSFHAPHLSSVRTRPESQSQPEVSTVSGVNCRESPKEPELESIGATKNLAVAATDDNMGILLAIRTPCGNRFNCLFQPTSSLQSVISAAQAKYGTRYERGLVETMDVPRRTFSDLTMTLAECGIVHRSVLCISQDDSAMDSH